MIAKRVINAVGQRLREQDPHRWEGTPVTFRTHWNDENGDIDIRTCVMVHDMLEREFNVDIDEKRILLQSIEECFDHIMNDHKAV